MSSIEATEIDLGEHSLQQDSVEESEQLLKTFGTNSVVSHSPTPSCSYIKKMKAS
tara:strand:+ start:1131 stop:1295 length:165 start_codon:yes stop_codon:yes gene_type:complete